MNRNQNIRQNLRSLAAMVAAALLTACGALSADPALSAQNDEACSGTFGAVTFKNLNVPDGRTCVPNGTVVQGNVLQGNVLQGNVVVGTGSTLRAQSVRVGGNVQSGGHALVRVAGRSAVEGSVQPKQGRSAAVLDVRLNGDLQLESNRGEFNLSRNLVGGNLQANQNRGPLTLSTNRIDSLLQCQANTPPPTGGGTTASSKEDPCARL